MKTNFYLAFCFCLATMTCVVLMTEIVQWKCKRLTLSPLRTNFNLSLTVVTFDTVSLMGCGSFCTWASSLEIRKSFHVLQNRGRCQCKNETDDADDGQEEPEVTRGDMQLGNENKTHLNRSHKQDCRAYWNDRHTTDGIYTIRPSEKVPIKDVYCSMIIGKVMIQAHSGDEQMFKRTWSEYVHGFGDIAEDEDDITEYWLGLAYLHHLTRHGSQLFIRIKYKISKEIVCWVDYSDFRVGDSLSEYTLNVRGFFEMVMSSRCGDSLSSHSGLPFSAPRGDNGCADACAGGWWYPNNESCGQSGLNSMAARGGSHTCQFWATREWMEIRKSHVKTTMFILTNTKLYM